MAKKSKPKRPSKTKRNRLALTVAMWTISVGLAGVAVIGFFTVRAYYHPFKKAPIHDEGDWYFEDDPDIGYVPKKNGSTFRRNPSTGLAFHSYGDKRGARVVHPGDQTPDQVDVATIGCSFTWGYGLDGQYAFTSLLRDRMGIPMANLGVNSYGTLNAVQFLRKNLDLKPKVVVYTFIDGHIDRNLTPCAPLGGPYCSPVSYVAFDDKGNPYLHPPHLEYMNSDTSRDFFTQILTHQDFSIYDIFWRMKVDLFNYAERETMKIDNNPTTRAASMAFVIDEMLKTTHSIGAKLLVVHTPYLTPGWVWPPNEALVNAVKGKDLTFLDLYPAVTEYFKTPGKPGLDIPVDSHPNVMGHDFLAQQMQPVIQALLKTP